MATQTENITNLVNTLNNTTMELNSIKEKINTSDQGLMDNNKNYYARFKDLGSEITDKQLITILQDAKDQHQIWMDTLERAVVNKQIIPLQTNSTRCGFGHFYQSLTVDDKRIARLWEEIDKHHEELHKLGETILTLIWNKDYKGANDKYEAAKRASGEVFRIIDDMVLELEN